MPLALQDVYEQGWSQQQVARQGRFENSKNSTATVLVVSSTGGGFVRLTTVGLIPSCLLT